MKKKPTGLVSAYIENLRREALEQHLREVKNHAKDKHGIYALYRGTKIYYVGLARSLSQRLKHHLKDRHEGHWDSFSLYITSDYSALRELESLILRVLQPKGNRTKGKLKLAYDLKDDLLKELEEKQKAERDFLLGRRDSKRPIVPTEKLKEGQTELIAYGLASMNIYATYKGKSYKARIDRNGWIRFNGKKYPSLSASGQAVRKKPTNGWWFWKFKDRDGKLVRIDAKR